jgi:hypothetical protein
MLGAVGAPLYEEFEYKMDWSVPTHSRAALTPALSVISMTFLMASSPRSSTMSGGAELLGDCLTIGVTGDDA